MKHLRKANKKSFKALGYKISELVLHDLQIRAKNESSLKTTFDSRDFAFRIKLSKS